MIAVSGSLSESALPNLGHTSESFGQVLKAARPGPYTSRDSGLIGLGGVWELALLSSSPGDSEVCKVL